MSYVLDYIEHNPQEVQRLVGLKYEQLEQLMKQAIALHTQKQQESEAKKVRIINKGGGRKVKLSTEQQILLTLIYLRHLTHCPLKFCLSVAAPLGSFLCLVDLSSKSGTRFNKAGRIFTCKTP